MFFRFIHFHVMKRYRFDIKNIKKSSNTPDGVIYIYIYIRVYKGRAVSGY